jgi:hypothetical protein
LVIAAARAQKAADYILRRQLLAALRNGVIPAIRKSGVFGCRGSAAGVGVGEVCDVAGV